MGFKRTWVKSSEPIKETRERILNVYKLTKKAAAVCGGGRDDMYS